MRAAESIDDYIREWRDTYVLEREFCAFHASPDLFGLIVWGRPDVNAAQAITRSREPELLHPEAHRTVLDYRSLEVVDRDAFACMGQWVAANRDELTRRTAKVALVQPAEPFAAAIVAGFYRVVTPPYPSQLCSTIEEADAWLGGGVATPVGAIRDLCAIGRPTTAQLSRLLERTPGIGIDEAARELAMTTRTLQRRLRDEGTSLRAESRKAMVRKAKALLTTTDEKIAEIARSVGCDSAQHFTELFKAETGMPPAAWRARTRSA